MKNLHESGLAVFVLMGLCLLSLTLQPITVADDFFWRLSLGLDVLEGLSYNTDRYSIVDFGRTYQSAGFVFDVLLAALYKIGGIFILQGFQLLVWMTGLTILVSRFAPNEETHTSHPTQSQDRVIAKFMILSLYLCAVAYRPLLRPEMLMFPVLISLSFWAFEALENPIQIRWQGFLKPLFLFSLWNICHWSALLATPPFFIVFLFWAIEIHRQPRPLAYRLWTTWSNCIGMFLVCGWLNLTGEHLFRLYFDFPKEWSNVIGEYELQTLRSLSATFLVLWIGVVLSLMWTLVRRQYASTAMILIYSYLVFFKGVRFWPPLLLVTAASLTYLISSKSPKPSFSLKILWFPRFFALGVFITVLFFALPRVFERPPIGGLSARNLNLISVEKLSSKGEPVSVLSDFGTSALMIFMGRGLFRVFIDGRAHLLYPFERFVEFTRINLDGLFLDEMSTKYKITHIFGQLTSQFHAPLTALWGSQFYLEFIDPGGALTLQKNSGRLSHLGKILVLPHCEKHFDKNTILRELERVQKDFSLEKIPAVLETLRRELLTPGSSTGSNFSAIDHSTFFVDATSRRNAFLFWNQGELSKAREWLMRITFKTPYDSILLNNTQHVPWETALTNFSYPLHREVSLRENLRHDSRFNWSRSLLVPFPKCEIEKPR